MKICAAEVHYSTQASTVNKCDVTSELLYHNGSYMDSHRGVHQAVTVPTRSTFSNGNGKVLDHIIIKNTQQTVPYQSAPLSPNVWCDCLPVIALPSSGCNLSITYFVSTNKVKRASKKTGDSFVDQGANGGVAAEDMAPMDNLYPSDCFVSITGIGDHLIPNKRVGRYCAVSKSIHNKCLCIYAE